LTDGWNSQAPSKTCRRFETVVGIETAEKTIITNATNRRHFLPTARSIRTAELASTACIYCFGGGRTAAFMGLSPGLDFANPESCS
jgi:hypothetical protein